MSGLLKRFWLKLTTREPDQTTVWRNESSNHSLKNDRSTTASIPASSHREESRNQIREPLPTMDRENESDKQDPANDESAADTSSAPDLSEEPQSEDDYRNELAEIDDLTDLDWQYQNCQDGFRPLALERCRQLIAELDDIDEVADLHGQVNSEVIQELLVARYEQLLPRGCYADLDEIEGLYENCPDTERFGPAIKQLYQGLLSRCDSLDELEDKFRGCAEEFNRFFLVPYQKLLYAENSLSEIEDRYKECDDFFNSLFALPYALLLKKEGSLEELEDRLRECPDCFDGLVIVRYWEVLQTVTSLEEAVELFQGCDECLNGMVLARYQELLPAFLDGLSPTEIQEFCENAEDQFQPLVLACADQLRNAAVH